MADPMAPLDPAMVAFRNYDPLPLWEPSPRRRNVNAIIDSVHVHDDQVREHPFVCLLLESIRSPTIPHLRSSPLQLRQIAICFPQVT